ncbi:MAG: hypothetical protein B9S32_06995 [Verrucomicrobia bacterium Tous-C9LFEB]|nr:MAG: hypothetical protein B9S32_06995 [Verrucomicrobia bacterium Tous-C9LFEB]
MNRWMEWRGLVVAMIATSGLTALADFLLWNHRPGLSWAIFVTALAATLWLVQGCRRRPWIAWTLLAGAVAQSVMQIGLANVIVEIVLILFLVSEWYGPELQGRWSRWTEAVWALVKAPFRWVWLLAELLRDPLDTAGVITQRLWHATMIFAPALVVTVVFALLLGSGNAIYGQWMGHLPERFFDWLWSQVSFGRLLFWATMATLFLAMVRPARASKKPRPWVFEPGRFPEPSKMWVARWRGYAVLLAVNLLYLGANGIDAIYLWEQAVLPPDVTLSEYVHQGVASLIASTVIAGVVLILIHQQADAAVTRWTRALSYAWIAQNGLLLIGVLRRLRLYVESYQLSEARVNVALFLVLVACGFALLAVYLQRRHSFTWLLTRGVAAVLILFYVVQFFDTAQWVAAYNVSAWRNHPRSDRYLAFDVEYLRELGPTAWPSLKQVAESDYQPDASRAAKALHEALVYDQTLDNWRSWQWRAAKAIRECQPTSKPPAVPQTDATRVYEDSATANEEKLSASSPEGRAAP